MTKKLIAFTILSLGVLAVAPTLANAGTWYQEHPRRAEVNSRLNKQNFRINQERINGEITRSEARELHAEDRTIRQEERLMARQNGGHLTRSEQRVLNQQENKNSRAIGH